MSMDGSGKYIINLKKMAKALSEIEISPGLTEVDLSKLEKLLEDNLTAIIELLKQLRGDRNVRHKDMSIHMPALPLQFEEIITLSTDALITGLNFSQSAWKVQDKVSFLAGDNVIIDAIHTKELGEEKAFPVGVFAPAGTELKIHYDNISGNSKMFFCDVNYIELHKEAGKE